MPEKTKALLMNLGAIICWSIAPLMIRYLSGYYTVVFQTFFRYLSALVVLWGFVLLREGSDKIKSDLPRLLSRWYKLLIIALACYGFQITFTYAFYLLYPGFATLINQSLVLFSVFLAALIFPDERPTLRSGIFFVGLVLALSGVVLTIVGGESFGAPQFNLGILVMLCSALCWALLGALIRKWLVGVSATLAVSTVFSIVTPLFMFTWIAMDSALGFPQAPPAIWALLVVSGLVGVGVGHALYYRAVGVLGLALSSSLTLLIPLLVGVASFLLFREKLTWMQLVGGGGLLCGCYIIIRTRFRHLR